MPPVRGTVDHTNPLFRMTFWLWLPLLVAGNMTTNSKSHQLHLTNSSTQNRNSPDFASQFQSLSPSLQKYRFGDGVSSRLGTRSQRDYKMLEGGLSVENTFAPTNLNHRSVGVRNGRNNGSRHSNFQLNHEESKKANGIFASTQPHDAMLVHLFEHRFEEVDTVHGGRSSNDNGITNNKMASTTATEDDGQQQQQEGMHQENYAEKKAKKQTTKNTSPHTSVGDKEIISLANNTTLQQDTIPSDPFQHAPANYAHAPADVSVVPHNVTSGHQENHSSSATQITEHTTVGEPDLTPFHASTGMDITHGINCSNSLSVPMDFMDSVFEWDLPPVPPILPAATTTNTSTPASLEPPRTIEYPKPSTTITTTPNISAVLDTTRAVEPFTSKPSNSAPMEPPRGIESSSTSVKSQQEEAPAAPPAEKSTAQCRLGQLILLPNLEVLYINPPTILKYSYDSKLNKWTPYDCWEGIGFIGNAMQNLKMYSALVEKESLFLFGGESPSTFSSWFYQYRMDKRFWAKHVHGSMNEGTPYPVKLCASCRVVAPDDEEEDSKRRRKKKNSTNASITYFAIFGGIIEDEASMLQCTNYESLPWYVKRGISHEGQPSRTQTTSEKRTSRSRRLKSTSHRRSSGRKRSSLHSTEPAVLPLSNELFAFNMKSNSWEFMGPDDEDVEEVKNWPVARAASCIHWRSGTNSLILHGGFSMHGGAQKSGVKSSPISLNLVSGEVAEYSLSTHVWTYHSTVYFDRDANAIVPQGIRRCFHSSVIHGQKLYVFGGYDSVPSSLSQPGITDGIYVLDFNFYRWHKISFVSSISPMWETRLQFLNTTETKESEYRCIDQPILAISGTTLNEENISSHILHMVSFSDDPPSLQSATSQQSELKRMLQTGQHTDVLIAYKESRKRKERPAVVFRS